MSEPKKYLHVGFMIEDKNLWDVLRLLEAHKIGQPEVRHVPPPLLALPAPEEKPRDKRGHKAYGTVQAKLRAAMPLKHRINVQRFSKETGESYGAVHSAMLALMRKGIVKKVAPGTFMRVKLDQPPEHMNGGASE
jgi:hypothetical protein